MKKVLIVAYYFPPMGMGGVQRTQKFVKYLPEFGWEPVVLTVRDVLYHAWDDSLLDEIRDRQIVRTGSLDPLRVWKKLSGKADQRDSRPRDRSGFLALLYHHLFSSLLLPDAKCLWVPHCLAAARRLIRSQSVDLVYTTSPPLSVHLAGHFLKKRTGLPWVVDFRDGLSEPYQQGPTTLHRRANRWIMGRLIRHADAVSTVSRPIGDELMRLAGPSAVECHIIPNGFDRADFEDSVTKLPEKWTLTYCGTVSPIQYPGFFLQAVSRALHECPELKNDLRIQFVGSVVGVPLHRMVRRLGLDANVLITGYVSHRQSVRYLMQSHLLLLLLNENLSRGMVTGKLLEYLASGKPILAAVPKGEAERLVLTYARGVVMSPTDVNGIRKQILRSYALWKRGDLKVSVPRWQGLDCFDRKKQAGDLAEVFNRCLDNTRKSG